MKERKKFTVGFTVGPQHQSDRSDHRSRSKFKDEVINDDIMLIYI